MQVAVQSCAGESKQPHYRWWSVINGMLMFEYSAERVGGGGALAGVTGAGCRTLHHNPAPLPHKEEMGKKENGK